MLRKARTRPAPATLAVRASTRRRFGAATVVLAIVMAAGVATRVHTHVLPLPHVVTMAAVITWWLYELTRWLTRLRIVLPPNIAVGAPFAPLATVTSVFDPRTRHATVKARERSAGKTHELAALDATGPIALPAGLPGTLAEGPHRVEWTLACRVELRGFPALALEVPLQVAWGPLPPRKRRPIVVEAPPSVANPRLALVPETVAPGAPLEGAVAWTGAAPRQARVWLEWATRSRTEGRHIVRVSEIDVDLAGGEPARFTLPAPTAPLTYDGKLFAVAWSLVLVATDQDGGETTDRFAITIG